MNDIHKPSNFIPTDYTVVDYLDNKPPEAFPFFAGSSIMGLRSADEAAAAFQQEKSWYHRHFAKNFGWSPVKGVANIPHRCDHCGAHIRYVVAVHHQPTDTMIAMGETCAERVDLSLDQHQLKNLHDVAKKRALTIKLGGRAQRFLAENPEFAAARQQWSESGAYDDFIDDVLGKFNQNGELTEPQVEAVLKSITRNLKWAAERAERKAQQAAKSAALAASGITIAEGRYMITGTIIAEKYVDSDFGSTHKMLVESEEGLKYWGTVPSALEGNKGDTIQFNATVTPSDDDKAFGFFKRPAKASVIKAAA